MIFQCLGITGAILLFYSLVSAAVVQGMSIYLWVMLGTGLVSLLAFVIFALARVWQKILGICVISLLVVIGLCYGTGQIPALDKYAKFLTSLYCLLGIVAAIWFSRNLFKVAFESRRSKYGTTAVIYSIVVFFILIVVNIGSQDFHKTFDFTNESVNTLSEQTEKIVADLKEPMHITAFFEAQTQDQANAKAYVKDLLNRYRSLNKNIDVIFADPDKEKILADAKHAGDGDIVLEYGKQTHITRDGTEQGITQAILKITRTDTPHVCFTSGHGEMSLDDPEDQPRSLSILKASLANEGYESQVLPLLNDKIPEECVMLIVASPFQAFPQAEVNVVEQYLNDGGRLIMLLDPILPNMKIVQKQLSIQPTGFEDMLKKWGIKLGGHFILEKHIRVMEGEVVEPIVQTMNYGNHPIVDALKSNATGFSTVQAVKKIDGFSGTTYELIKSAGNDKSWEETNTDLLLRNRKADPEKDDVIGPITIAMASEKETPKKAQLLVFGDGDFVSNGLIGNFKFNYDLFLNAVNWMAGDTQRISIRPKKISTSALELTPEQSIIVFYVAIVTLPMLVLIFGINLWWFRRRRG